VIAALSAWHERHEHAARALAEITALPAHAVVEAYAVLTRLPAGLAVERTTAARVLAARFPDPPLRLSDRAPVLSRLASASVSGGATYDGLVALEAAEHDHELLTLDERAVAAYVRLGVRFRVL
jgi:hypothetical protein